MDVIRMAADHLDSVPSQPPNAREGIAGILPVRCHTSKSVRSSGGELEWRRVASHCQEQPHFNTLRPSEQLKQGCCQLLAVVA